MQTYTLTAADHGRTIELRLGDELDLELAENPSTGYRWHAVCDRALTLVVSDWQPTVALLIGGGGTRRLRFRATAAGSGQIQAKYWREWIGDSSVTERLSFSVVVG